MHKMVDIHIKFEIATPQSSKHRIYRYKIPQLLLVLHIMEFQRN